MKKLRATRAFDLLEKNEEFWVETPMSPRLSALLGVGYLEEIDDDEQPSEPAAVAVE